MKKYFLAAIMIVVGFSFSCSKFEELNHNPNQVTYGETNPTKLMSDIIYSGHWTIFYRSWRINSQLMQYSMYVNGQELSSNYDVRATESTQLWNNLFRWASSADHMYDVAKEKEDGNSMAIALTLKVYLAEAATSIFGDMPYSEAFNWENGVSHPLYDKQEDIYLSMVSELNTANDLYDTSKKLDYPDRDILYGGDISKWQKFTNSLRLRLLMRMSKNECEDLDIPAEMNLMVNNPSMYPVFESNSDAAILRYTGVNPNYNGFGETTATDPMSQNNKMGHTLMKLMTDCSDPRLPYYADAKNGDYIGLLSGQTNDYIAANQSLACTYAKALSTDTSPSTLMNYSELLFIITEAQFRGLVSSGKTTEELYNEAVVASVRERMGKETWSPGAFLTAPSTAAYDGTIERIMEQKYVATFLVGYEAWCDYRRTGLPVMPVGPSMVNKDSEGNVVLPTRLRYPLITQTTNYDNWKEAVSALETGEDDMLSRVWFARGERY